jgi:hypothetical protein
MEPPVPGAPPAPEDPPASPIGGPTLLLHPSAKAKNNQAPRRMARDAQASENQDSRRISRSLRKSVNSFVMGKTLSV